MIHEPASMHRWRIFKGLFPVAADDDAGPGHSAAAVEAAREPDPCNDTVDGEPVLSTTAMRRQAPTEELLAKGFVFRLAPCQLHRGKEDDSGEEAQDVCFECATRLFHIESGEMITAENRSTYIPDGLQFQKVSSLCQEMVQDRLVNEHALKFITICDDPTLGAPVRALVDVDYDEQSTQPVLLIITGKGESRAGVLSVKQVLISGIEVGSAMYYLIQARKRGWLPILLDPNAWGAQSGMDVLEQSLTHIFASWKSPLYVLAHSAAGGYLVRYLLTGSARQTLLQSLCGIAFSDSTHRLQWCRDDPWLYEFLQSSRHCLYIRNNSTPQSAFSTHVDAAAGQRVSTDIWWKNRFGSIPTVWAGTTEHSLVCWAARHVIWNFFVSLREE